MNRIYNEFFRKLLDNEDKLSTYVDSLYAGSDYSEDDLNHMFGVLKNEGLIVCTYADDRAWVQCITFAGKHYFNDEGIPRIAELIDQMDEIEKLFHTVGGNGMPAVDAIYDVPDFQDWLQEVNLELREIHNRTGDHFIWETLNLFSRNMNGWTDKQVFSELKGKLRAIRRNIGKYYPENETADNEQKGEDTKKMKKTPKIFISHSSKDVSYVTQIVNLLDGMGLNQTQIFCSSLPGYGIPIDTDIFDYLRKLFSEHDLHVIFVHSNNYYKSSVSLNEMGAAWVLRNEVTSVLLPGFGFDQMTGVVNGNSISIKLDMPEIELKDKLNQLYDKIVQEFGITKKADIIWEQKRDSFIKEVQQGNAKNTEKAKISEDALCLLKAAAGDDSGAVLKTSDLTNGTSVQGGAKVMNNGVGQRESARWEAALEELLNAKYVKQADSKGQVYHVTDAGYKYCESNY